MLTTENESIIPAATSMASSITSSTIPLRLMGIYSVQIFWTGTPVGTWTLQISDDVGTENPDGTFGGITHWSTYSGSSQAISAAGDLTYELTNSSHRWARVVYTAGSSTGSITSARFNAKGE